MKRIIMAISVLAITVLLSSCGASASPTNITPESNQDRYSESIESEVPEEAGNNYSTKEELFFNTKYTIHDDWTVEKINNDTGSFYKISLQNNDSDIMNNIIMISTMTGMIYENLEQAKADGYSETDFFKKQDVINSCFKTTKDALLASNIITPEYNEELFDLPETPVMHLKGIRDDYNHEIYLFMDDYSNVAIVQAYLTDTALSAEVRNMIDNLKFSYDGWKNEEKNSNLDMSNNNKDNNPSSGKSRTCPQCNGSGVIKYYYGASDLEAYLDGHEPYTMDTCPTCHGTGRYSGK